MSTIGLGRLLEAAGLPPASLAHGGPAIGDIAFDSRSVSSGSLFVAIPGRRADGHDFAARAVARGAAALVVERPVEGLGVPQVIVADSRRALSALAAALARHPSRSLTVAGVTGTDGKTITATMLWAAWRASGLVAGSVTTVDCRLGDAARANRTRQTTSEAVEVQRQLAEMRDAGCSHVALETSSHALELHRVADVEYRAAVYTRVTSEHLEVHGSRAAYIAAKRRLVEMVADRSDGIAVLDADDPDGFPVFAAVPVATRLTYSAAGDGGADLAASEIRVDSGGVGFVAATPWGGGEVRLRLGGRFNVANALAALGGSCATGASFEGAVAGLEALERVSGRMEPVRLGQPFSVVIDYAHTAEALDTVLKELRLTTPGRVWAVFGSAGDRDVQKRFEMGRVAAARCDRIILTDEDPRREDRLAILEAIAEGTGAGWRQDGRLRLIPDRAEAIRAAMAEAEPGDTVLLAGKGHESSIETGDASVPWDEREVAEAALRDRLSAGG